MDAVQAFLNWYLSPWQRVNRMVFNVVLFAASLPGLLLSVAGFTNGAGGVLGSLMDMMAAAKNLGALPEDPAGLQSALENMQKAGQGFEAAGAERVVQAVGLPWDTLVDGAIWLVLLPLVMMRLRDMGRKQRMVLVFTVFIYLGVVMDLWVDVGLPDLFGGWKTLADVVGFVLIGWLCVAPSKARERVDPMTAPGGSGMVRRDGQSLDDTDPYPPFRP
jgi:hypothetical protein